MKHRNIEALAGLLIAAAFTAGCSINTKSLDEAYSFERYQPILSEQAEAKARVGAFAANLCVVMEDPLDADDITSEAGLVFDRSSSRVISSKQAFETLHPASTTKIMTALLAVKYGDLSDQVTVTEDAVITEAGATLANVHPGDILTMEQLLYGLMLPSGNDAGAAIAIHMAGSVEEFSKMMNTEAAKLGATGTHFMNPHGLTDPDHYTTAYDLYLIFNEALNYPEFREIIGAASYQADYFDQSGAMITQTWKSGNRYMAGEQQAPEGLTVLGGKTGTTQAAGYCLVMAIRDTDNQEYISIVLKARNRQGLYDNMSKLIGKIVN